MLLILSIAMGWSSSFAQSSGDDTNNQLYVAETGHWVTGDFLKTYLGVPNPSKIYGYPITEAFQDQTYNRVIQYFQRARFEYLPGESAGLRVHISDLGSLLYSSGTALTMPPNSPACRVFIETNKQVCYTFLDFFNSNGGAAQFGYPISNFEIYNGWIVQYFQRARFEWHPELPPGERVVLADLGREYFDTMGENPTRLKAVNNSNIPQLVLSLQVRAFPARAVLSRAGTQTITVIVQDQKRLAVPNAQISMIVQLPSGKTIPIKDPGFTDDHGIIQVTFPYDDTDVGTAVIYVTAVYNNDFQQQTLTSFRLWW
jgi:hypothetical protein